jgi:hypothetical protein
MTLRNPTTVAGQKRQKALALGLILRQPLLIITLRCKAARNYLSANGIESLSLAGILVSWLARRWNNELSD